MLDDGIMGNFNEIFDELARHNDRSILWSNWLDYCININLLNPSEVDVNYYGNEEKYFLMFEEYVDTLNYTLENSDLGYCDLLGDLYEKCVKSHVKAKDLGQYYTPSGVTSLMSNLTINNVTSNEWVNDCCCGSGRMLLSAHVKSNGGLYCLGQDLDEVSCKMAVLNFFTHGVRGSILHMDSLKLDFYKGWRVNKFLYDGIPVPHVERVFSVREALGFIGESGGMLSLTKNDGEKSLIKNDNSVQTKLL